jgi:hypothetical protein
LARAPGRETMPLGLDKQSVSRPPPRNRPGRRVTFPNAGTACWPYAPICRQPARVETSMKLMALPSASVFSRSGTRASRANAARACRRAQRKPTRRRQPATSFPRRSRGRRRLGVDTIRGFEIIGRERTLPVSTPSSSRCPRGPAPFVIEGEPGIGKTTVWRASVKAATARPRGTEHEAGRSRRVALACGSRSWSGR